MRTWMAGAIALMMLTIAGCSDTLVAAGDCGKCSTNASCGKDSAGLPKCVCKPGFSGDGLSCEPDAVTEEDCGGCSSDGTCVKRDGSPRCLCNHGFWGDGKTCTAAADCDDHNGSCHPFAQCLGQGSITCECAYGSEGDGYECVVPDGGHVRLAGRLEACLTPAGTPCTNGSEHWAWELSVPLTLQGDTYKGTATADVFDASASVRFLDKVTGEYEASVDVTTFNVVRTITFRFNTDASALESAEEIPHGELPLKILGTPTKWYFQGPSGKSTYLSGQLTAVFQK